MIFIYWGGFCVLNKDTTSFDSFVVEHKPSEIIETYKW